MQRQTHTEERQSEGTQGTRPCEGGGRGGSEAPSGGELGVMTGR